MQLHFQSILHLINKFIKIYFIFEINHGILCEKKEELFFEQLFPSFYKIPFTVISPIQIVIFFQNELVILQNVKR